MEKQISVTLKNVVALEYECPSCHSRLSMPLQKATLMYSCQLCGHVWLQRLSDSGEAQTLDGLIQAFKAMQRLDFAKCLHLVVERTDTLTKATNESK